MTRNPILEELYAIREKLLKDAGGDVKTFLAGVRKREEASGRLLKPTAHRTNRGDVAAASNVATVESQTSPLVDR